MIVEPKHEMYLNTLFASIVAVIIFVEPKHEMYLNGVFSTVIGCVEIGRTET